jgi:hypothetical protein
MKRRLAIVDTVNAATNDVDDGALCTGSSQLVEIADSKKLAVRYINNAVVDPHGHIEYSYGIRARTTRRGVKNDFTNIYTLAWRCCDDGTREFQWLNLQTNTKLASISYPTLVHGGRCQTHVDAEHMMLAYGWKVNDVHRVDIWNLESNESVAIFHDFRDFPLPNIHGERLLIAEEDSKSISYWNVLTRQRIFKKEASSSSGRWYMFQTSDNSKLLIAYEGILQVLDSVAGEELLTNTIAVRENVECITMSPDGSMYFLLHSSHIAVFEAVSLSKVTELRYEYSYPHFLGFGPDARTIYIGGRDGYIVWDYDAGTKENVVVRVKGGGCARFHLTCFNSTNNTVVGCDNRFARAYAFDCNRRYTTVVASKSGKVLPVGLFRIYYSAPSLGMVLL